MVMASPKSKILVIEDESTTKALIQYKLQNSGYEVFCVSDGTEGLSFLENTVPDLIILDLMMPLMSGKEFLLHLRRNERLPHIPVIILTAKTLERDVVEGLSLGADDFVKKPFSPSELVARVRAHLARRKPA
jgi:two-component system, OmpR family, alkaline phosphatase synthesis response regulator PhoP